MKKFHLKSVAGIALTLCLALASFSFKKGGDSFEIFLNGKRMLQQFVHVSKEVQTLQIANTSASDKLDIYYSHCGQTGKNRVLTVRDEQNHVVNTWKFADSDNRHSTMSVRVKDVFGAQKNGSKLKVFYSSKELPEGKLLAMVTSENTSVTARK